MSRSGRRVRVVLAAVVLVVAASLGALVLVRTGSATSAATDRPTRPTAVAVVPGDARVLLTWKPVRGAEYYRIFMDGQRIARTSVAAFPVLNLQNGRTYEFAVRAVNREGRSRPSQPVTGTPMARLSTSPTRLAWFYKPPARDRGFVLTRFDAFVLTRGDEVFRASVRAAQPGTPVLQYLLLTQIIKPPEPGQEQRNNAAYLPGDFDRLWQRHPDWFLRDDQGRPIVEDGKYYRMDPGNREWQDFWITRARASNGSWDGIFLDNLDLSLTGLRRQGISVPAYPTDEAYTDALAGFVEAIHHRVSEPTGKPLFANVVHGGLGHPAQAKYMPYLDGVMEEGWAVGWGMSRLGEAAWRKHLDAVEFLTSQGKGAILVAQGDESDARRQEFAYASYLLVAAPGVSFRYTQTGSYLYPWRYDLYDLALGQPLGPRYRLDDGTDRRDFTDGCVVVNPHLHVAAIIVGACSPAGIPAEVGDRFPR